MDTVRSGANVTEVAFYGAVRALAAATMKLNGVHSDLAPARTRLSAATNEVVALLGERESLQSQLAATPTKEQLLEVQAELLIKAIVSDATKRDLEFTQAELGTANDRFAAVHLEVSTLEVAFSREVQAFATVTFSAWPGE